MFLQNLQKNIFHSDKYSANCFRNAIRNAGRCLCKISDILKSGWVCRIYSIL